VFTTAGDRILLVSAAGKAEAMNKENGGKWKHLTEEERARIAILLSEGHRVTDIGRLLGKDPTTITKEIRTHRYKRQHAGSHRHLCGNEKGCKVKDLCGDRAGKCFKYCRTCPWCTRHCPDFVPFRDECCRESKTPYVCNGCDKHIYRRCARDQYFYGAEHAQKEYRQLLVESRIGADRTPDEMAAIEELTAPLIKQGQPLSHIYAHHRNELTISERTFYRYVDSGHIGLKNIDMRRVVRYKKRKRKTVPKPVRAAKIGHTYDCFKEFVSKNTDIRISEMDFVEGKRSDRKKILTLMPRDLRLMLMFLVERKTLENAVTIIDALEDAVGAEAFRKLYPAILTDNDTAFADPKRFEADADGVVRTKLFYCDPYRSNQKGALEKNHEFIRYIIPKGKTFENLTEENVRDMMNHINSTARPELGGKCPMELALQEFDERTLTNLGLRLIPCDEVCLKPQLIRSAEPTR
jgi:IS30 family transposase